MDTSALVQEIKIETFGADGRNMGTVKAVGLPPLRDVVKSAADPSLGGKQRFLTLKTKYHVFPGFPDPNVASDLADLIKQQVLDPNVGKSAELAIKYGGDELSTGFYLIVHTPNAGPVPIPLGVVAYEVETQGQETVFSALRKRFEGTGAL